MDPFRTFAPEDIQYQNDTLLPAFKTVPYSGAIQSPIYAAKLEEINQRAPWLTPETMMTLAKANASTEAIDRVGQFAGQRQIDTYEERVAKTGQLWAPIRWAYSGIGLAAKTAKAAYNKVIPGPARFILSESTEAAGQLVSDAYGAVAPGIKPVTRWGVAALDIIPETIQNVSSMVLGQSSYDIGGLWSSTSIATLLDARNEGVDIGTGYLMSERVRQEQAKRARLFRGVTDNGAAFTLGRGSAGTIFQEGSQAYNYASGIIDAIVLLTSPDPTKYITKTAKGIAGGVGALKSGLTFAEGYKAGGGIRGIVPLLSSEDALSVRKAFADTAHGEAGLVKEITGATVRGEKFVNWMRKNASAQRLVTLLKDETSVATIQDEIFKYKISNDIAVRLANAKSEDEVISALTYGWTYGENALSANIGKYRVSRSPFIQGIRKSKYFTQLPKQSIIVDGDEVQSAEAVKNAVNTMRSGGVPEAEIKLWLDGTPAKDGVPAKMGAIKAFTQNMGSAVDRKNSLTAFNELVALTLKNNGVTAPIIKDVIFMASDHIDRVRNYMITRSGMGTDNGHLSMMVEMHRQSLPPDVFNTWLEGLGHFGADLEFAQPMQLVEMLNRVQVLPDVRKLRRLTRNRLMNNLIPKDEKGVAMVGKLALTSGKKKVNLTKILDEEAWQAADDELAHLESLEGPARLNASERIDELYDIKKSFEEEYEDWVISGNQRLLLNYIERLQNDIWKPLNLATFGYILRNGFDAQMRMAFGGINNLSHPFDYINLVIGSKYGKDIRGADITGLGFKKGFQRGLEEEDVLQGPEGYAYRAGNVDAEHKRRVFEQLRQNLSYAADRVGWTASDSYAKGVETGSFPVVTRNSGPSTYPTQYHTDGIVQAGQKTISDPLQSIAARGLSAGMDDEKIIDEMMEYLKDVRSPASRKLQALYRDGINYWDNGNLLKGFPVNLRELRKTDPAAYETQMRNHLRTIVLPNVKNNSGMLDDVLFMFAHDRVPYFKGTINKPVSEFPLAKNQKELQIGDIKTIPGADGKPVEGVINNISEAPDGTKIATFVPVSKNPALSRGAKRGKTGDRDARRLIERAPIYDPTTGKGLPEKITREQISWSTIKKPELDAMNTRAVGWFFNVLNDVSVRTLEKSPTFRTYYYKTIGEHIDQLSFEEGVKLYDDVLSKAKEEGKTIAQYLGEDSWIGMPGIKRNFGIAKKIEALPTRTNAKGTLTVEELDDFSRFKGLSDTQELLYDATNRNNFGDAMRVISPFAGAWMDVMGTWLSFSRTHNIQVARASQRVYTGLTNADPDQDGRGIFFRDPQTNQLMFTFPLSGGLTKLFTGINAPLAGPVQRLSGGIGFYPALGPWGQFAANQLIPDVPDYDKFRQLLTPYGEKTLLQTANPVPGYLGKILSAMSQNTEDLTSVYGQTYIETLRALSTNPNYNLNNSGDVIRLKADAKSRARILTVMRAVSQFTGPTAGTLEYKVSAKDGDVYVSELTKQLQMFQEEDYDSAIPRFLDLYGDELMLYASSKTKATQKGLETSIEFDAWTRNNKELLDEYPDLATYFAPKGSDFEFSVWDRQKRAGLRVPLSDQELIDTAQNRLGATKYRAARRQFGAFPTEEQTQKLKDYRIYLNQQLPGFPVNVEFKVNELKNDLLTLRRMVQDKRLADNPVTRSIILYLNAHDQALAKAGGKSLQSKKATPLRAQLYSFGESLAFQNPEFDRIWTRLLVSEVEE